MIHPRLSHAVTLAAAAAVIGLAAAPAAAAASGTFTATGSMHTTDFGGTATLLPGGQVLVAGGTSATAAAELYNPATGRFTRTGSMSDTRGPGLGGSGFTVGTLLPGGDVLVTGRSTLVFAERYHPATGQWSDASTGLIDCCGDDTTATLVGTGNVLVAGGLAGPGSNPRSTASAMLYQPGNNTWTSTGSMLTPRAGQTATLLPGGQVLVAGGTNFVNHVSTFLASAELYTRKRSRACGPGG